MQQGSPPRTGQEAQGRRGVRRPLQRALDLLHLGGQRDRGAGPAALRGGARSGSAPDGPWVLESADGAPARAGPGGRAAGVSGSTEVTLTAGAADAGDPRRHRRADRARRRGRGLPGDARALGPGRHPAGPARARRASGTSAPGCSSSAVGTDKTFMKLLFAAQGLPVLPWVLVRPGEWDRDPVAVSERVAALGLAGVRQAGAGRIELRDHPGRRARRPRRRPSGRRSGTTRRCSSRPPPCGAREVEIGVLQGAPGAAAGDQ